MTAAQQEERSFLQRVRQRSGSPLDWSNADRCLFGSLIVFSMSVPWNIWDLYYLSHVEEISFVSVEYSRSFLPVQIAAISGGWLLLVMTSAWARRYAPDTRILAHVICQYFALGFVYVTYSYGTFTSNFGSGVLLGGIALGFLVFDKRPMLCATASIVMLLVGTTIASQTGLIPYAPFMAGAPYENGRLAGLWLASYGVMNYAVTAMVAGIIYFVFYRWREQEEQLSRANELISRYVAAQVIERIHTGDYDSVNRHTRRKLTVFFSDIKNFTETTERMEAEELSDVLNEYLTEMTRIAEKYGGTIDKFVGDAIMIFFGAPDATSDEDHALRAVRMAVQMQERMKTLREEWRGRGIQLPFHVRMGVNTGHASIGNFGSAGRMDYTAIGRQVNLAARLEVNCEPDRVLISHSTWALVREKIPCTPKGEITAKGVRDPVEVYEVDSGWGGLRVEALPNPSP